MWQPSTLRSQFTRERTTPGPYSGPIIPIPATYRPPKAPTSAIRVIPGRAGTAELLSAARLEFCPGMCARRAAIGHRAMLLGSATLAKTRGTKNRMFRNVGNRGETDITAFPSAHPPPTDQGGVPFSSFLSREGDQ